MSDFPDSWQPLRIGDSGKWLSGGTPSTTTPEFWDGDIPWISSGSLTNFRLMDSDRRITPAGAQNGTRMVTAGTILMVVRGMSLKSEFRIGIAQRDMAFGQDCKALVARDDIDSEFLAYAIAARSSQILGIVDEAGHGTGRLNSDQLYAVEIGIPPRSEQRAIAEVLGALDDKMAANTKLAASTDAYIAASHASAIGEPGSKTLPLFDVFNIDFGEPFKGSMFSEPSVGRPLIRIRDLKTFRSQTWSTEHRPHEVLIQPGDVVVGMDAEFRPTTWLGEPGLLNQRVCRVRGKYSGPAFVRESLKEPLTRIENYKTATTVIHLNKKDLDETSILVPSPRALAMFETSVEGLYQLRVSIASENRILTATRDALLPQLMSGNLRVKDAETLVSAAV